MCIKAQTMGAIHTCGHCLFEKKHEIGAMNIILSVPEESKLDVQNVPYPSKSMLQGDRIGRAGSIFHLTVRRAKRRSVRRPQSSYGKMVLVKGKKELQKMQADPGGWR